MTPERIAEIEAAGADPKLDQGVMLIAELPELCRLARLGLRVEEAPFAIRIASNVDSRLLLGNWSRPFTLEEGKRVALVVLEDSK